MSDVLDNNRQRVYGGTCQIPFGGARPGLLLTSPPGCSVCQGPDNEQNEQSEQNEHAGSGAEGFTNGDRRFTHCRIVDR